MTRSSPEGDSFARRLGARPFRHDRRRGLTGNPGFPRVEYRGTNKRAAAGARRGEPGRCSARVNREGVALVREEWRVVDRWWTEEPLDRRYFDLVLESGRNACVFRDEEAGCWFSQRA